MIINEEKMNNYKIVSCASFGGTGSGVVTDYLAEFDCFHNPGDYEFCFLHDYGGVSTLEDCLISNYHRLNSDIAIHNFIKYIHLYSKTIFSKQYEKYFNGQFKAISFRFLDKLIDVQWKGSWAGQMLLYPSIHYPLFMYKVLPRILKFISGNRSYHGRFIPKHNMYYAGPPPEYFTKCVKEYIADLCCVVDPENRFEYLYFDQLLPAINIERYFKFFDNLQVIVMDRDPRDLYIDNLLNWKCSWIPFDVDTFIVLYKKIREKANMEKNNPNILRLRFEDTIYRYDEFKKTINNFLELNEFEHKLAKSKFNPEISIKNTQLWKIVKIDSSIINKIENNLSDYCYPY
ncbi:sulfotransferase family protein [Spirochaetia bacterium]|nr:sulfotransferase family protein [Spirochaetia bacterium]